MLYTNTKRIKRITLYKNKSLIKQYTESSLQIYYNHIIVNESLEHILLILKKNQKTINLIRRLGKCLRSNLVKETVKTLKALCQIYKQQSSSLVKKSVKRRGT